MIEALWSVEFQSSFGMQGAGIVVFETERVLGGDSGMMYVGSYRVENGSVYADIHVTRYANTANLQSVVGLDDFNLKITGKVDPRMMALSGHVVEDPSRKITINAVRRAELP